MLKLFLSAVLVLLALPATAQYSKSRTIGTPIAKEVLSLRQDVSVSGESTIFASVGPLTTSSSGFGIQRLNVPVQDVNLASLSKIDLPNPVNQATALGAAGIWVQSQAPSMRDYMSRYLQAKGLSVGFYNFYQEIMVETESAPVKRAIAFNLVVDNFGKLTYGNPKIVDPDPRILEATYTPLAAAAGLPATWKYPGGGKIKYRLLDNKYREVTGFREIDVAGAFDPPAVDGDIRASVPCLIDTRYTTDLNPCRSPTDIRSLMDRTGASFAIVNYLHPLTPEYKLMPDGTEVATSAVSVDDRRWDCNVFINSGVYGFVLSLVADQYIVQPAVTAYPFTAVGLLTGRGISPTEPYYKQVPAADLGGAAPDSFVINPDPSSNALLSRYDAQAMANFVYIAPIVADLKGGGLPDATLQYPRGGYVGDTVFNSAQNGPVTDYLVQSAVSWDDGTRDRMVTFNLTSPQSVEMLRVVDAGADDHIAINVNGVNIFAGPYGGTWIEDARDSTKCGTGRSAFSSVTYFSGGSISCVPRELGRLTAFNGINLDLKPYLRVGYNFVYIRTVVARGGGMYVRLRAQTCSAPPGSVSATPLVPASGGAGGVTGALAGK